MDSDHWISRLMAAKRQYALQRAQRHHASPASHNGTLRSHRLGYDDIEPEDEAHSDFPCPYCYEDHDITSLCSHLEDEHPFESKIVRHHRLRRVAGTGNYTPSYAGRDLQDTYLKVLLGNSNRSGSTNTSTSVTDSLLSSLVLNLSSSEAEDTSKSSAPAVVENNWFKRTLPSKTWKTRLNVSCISFLVLLIPTLAMKRGSEGRGELQLDQLLYSISWSLPFLMTSRTTAA
ncbi:hypothetical protein PR202_ga07321 [Eleusine coracana subsp. coracana]|uniref:Uncharacterized protein n=1 Tax=Eleusine coracana subsp. coracana TaxID=191504 RepID=A0AAV5BXA5_ELECO|nr:hypothetical protein PR202_ga07321 [Eleusine coracana subsp. coracana]